MADATPHRDPDRNHHGFALALIGFAAFSGMDILSKLLSLNHSLQQILCLSGLFTIAAALPFARVLGGLRVHSRAGLAVILARGLMSVAMIGLTLGAISLMPVANVYAIRFCSPLLTTVLATVILAETPTRLQWVGTAVAFVGVLLILQPDASVETIGLFCALGAALAQALSTLLVRLWKAHSTPLADTLIPISILVAVTGSQLPGHYTSPTPFEWVLYAVAGCLLAIGRLCLTLALRAAPSAIVAPVQYTQLIWALGFDWLLFGLAPTLSVIASAGLIIAGTLAGRVTGAPNQRQPG